MSDQRDEDWAPAAPQDPSAPQATLSPEEREDVQRRIGALRDEIDRLDEQLVRFLSRRAACALEIGHLKTHLGMQIYQPSREQAVLQHVRDVNEGPLDDDAIARLFERIIDEARRLEREGHDQEGRQD